MLAAATEQFLPAAFAGVLPLGPAIGLVFTVLWFVGITNAFNLIDGLDGLAIGLMIVLTFQALDNINQLKWTVVK